MLSSYLEKIALSFSEKVENFENFWKQEEIGILKRFVLQNFRDLEGFLFKNGKPRIFILENSGKVKNLEDVINYLLKNSGKLGDEEKYIYILYLIKLKILKFSEENIKNYEKEIVNLFKNKSFQVLSSLLLKVEEYFFKTAGEELNTEEMVQRIDRNFIHLLKIFHTFYMERGFEELCLKEKENLERYLRGFTLPEKYKSKLKKEWAKSLKELIEDENYLKNLELQEKKLIDELKDSVNLEINDFSHELKNYIQQEKFTLLLPYIKEKTAKWLRSFGIILRDYNSLQRLKREYKERTKENLFEGEISPFLPSPDILIKEWEEIQVLFSKETPKDKKILEQIFFEYYTQKKKDREISEFFESFVKKGFISFQLDFDMLKREFSYFMEEKFIPQVVGSLLLKQVYLIPDELKDGKDVVYWITFRKLPDGEYFILPDMESLKIEMPMIKKKEDFYNRFKEIVCVLVYDIRGSTFMSLKLKEPAREFSIKNNFNREMLSIIKRYGGFPLKDLGDGGIIIFSQNSREIFEEIFEEAFLPKKRTLRIPKLFEKEVKLMPSFDSSIRAILCARDMYFASLKFIREKYAEYRDWFPDVVDNYPPLKALFRLGIGVGGGKPGKSLYIDYNGFGDVDAAGSIINIANLLAHGRDPLSSTIYIDSTTFFSFLLNSSDWEVETEEEGIFERIKFYLDNLDEFWTFNFPLKKIKIRIAGTDLLDQPEKEKGLVFQVPEELEFGEDDEFIVKNHPVKLVYQVEPYE